MRKHHPENERVKRKYFTFLKEAKRQDDSSVDAAAKSISRFEEYTSWKDFKAFHYQQAIGFKSFLARHKNVKTGKSLSKATMNSTLCSLKAFFQWLSMQQGYKSRINYPEAEYFNLSEKDSRVATAKRRSRIPTIDQIRKAIFAMPHQSVIEQRNRALIAFTILTGARDSAIASMKLKHVDVDSECVFQDAREVKTKASKTFTSYFFPVGEDVRQIVLDWLEFLRAELLFGNDDPVFPKTALVRGGRHVFEASGVLREHWSTTTPIRKIFKSAFEAAGLEYFNPHSFRKTLGQLGETACRSPEEFKAWSQNLGHEGVLTTFYSYGEVQEGRQSEILKTLKRSRNPTYSAQVEEIAAAVLRQLNTEV
jgi:integrase/recombinase XerD